MGWCVFLEIESDGKCVFVFFDLASFGGRCGGIGRFSLLFVGIGESKNPTIDFKTNFLFLCLQQLLN